MHLEAKESDKPSGNMRRRCGRFYRVGGADCGGKACYWTAETTLKTFPMLNHHQTSARDGWRELIMRSGK